MESLKGDADLIIDTSGMSPHELRDRIREVFAEAPARAEPAGVAGLVRLQVRPAPGRRPRPRRAVPARTRTGSSASGPCPAPTPGSATYVDGPAGLRGVHAPAAVAADTVVPGYVAEGKSYLTIAVGCTGGRHRSVVVAEELGRVLPQARPLGGRRPSRPRPGLAARPGRPVAAGGPGRPDGTASGAAPAPPASTRRTHMAIKIGINGFGRIGRNFLRAARGSRARTSTSSR